MARKELTNKPLIEAIFELRWQLDQIQPNLFKDPHYSMLIGMLYDRQKGAYSYHESLPTANMPEEIAGYVVQHRLRKANNEWPLIQLGPGIVTVNDTSGYVWEDFKRRVDDVVKDLFDIYRGYQKDIKVNQVLLRYIDAEPFDYEKEDIVAFLSEKLKNTIVVYPALFEDDRVTKTPVGLDLRMDFVSSRPKGKMHLRFATGTRSAEKALIWETMIMTGPPDLPQTPDAISNWVCEAHDLTRDWFFKLIDGELLRKYE